MCELQKALTMERDIPEIFIRNIQLGLNCELLIGTDIGPRVAPHTFAIRFVLSINIIVLNNALYLK